MERDHFGWRRMYTKNEQRHFSCWKTTISLMDEEIVLQGNADTALQELDEVFTAVTPFMKLLQKQKKDQSNSNESSVNEFSQVKDV